MKKEKTENTFTFTVHLWLYPGENASWHFLSVPKKESAVIRDRFSEFTRGWGSLPVEVRIHTTHWKTSIFPDRKAGTYLLPIKKKVRESEGLEVGDAVTVTITIQP